MRYSREELREGQLISCKINKKIISEAKITYVEGRMHICQNVSNGRTINKSTRYGYKYAWVTSYPDVGGLQGVSNVKILHDAKKMDGYDIF